MPSPVIHDLANGVLRLQAAAPAAITTTTTSTAIDMLTSDGRCVLEINLGAVTGTTPTYTLQITQCATSGGTYTNIPTNSLTATLNAANANTYVLLSFDRDQRFIKIVETLGGTTPSYTRAVSILAALKTF